MRDLKDTEGKSHDEMSERGDRELSKPHRLAYLTQKDIFPISSKGSVCPKSKAIAAGWLFSAPSQVLSRHLLVATLRTQ